jgi:hypothetical protein
MSSGLQQTNPGAYNAIQGYTQEINTAVQQMIGRGGINPTQVGLQAGNLDISNLPVSQLQSVLDNLQITGQATQGVYQKIAFEAGGGGATNAYMGGNVKTPTASTPVTPQPILPSDKSSYANAGIGAATTLFGDIGSVAKAAAGPVLDFLGLSSFF